MDATAWTVIGTGITILIAVGAAFRSLRSEMRLFREHVDKRIDTHGERLTAQGDQLRERIDAQGQELRERIDAQGQELRDRIDAQGQELRERIDAQGQELRDRIDAQGRETSEQLGQLRERMAKLEGLLEGLREAVTGKRAA